MNKHTKTSSRLRPLSILGLGTALPPYSCPQDLAADFARNILGTESRITRLLPALYRRAGVRQRYSVLLRDGTGELTAQSFFHPPSAEQPQGPTTKERMRVYAEQAPALAARAGEAALRQARVEAASITHLITVSCSGFDAPGVEVYLIRALGLPANIARTHIGFMGCHGALNGLRVAQAFAAADPEARILLVAVELCSLHFHYGDDPEQMVANALFADGAAALVAHAENNGQNHNQHWQLCSSGSCVLPESADAMTWRIGDNGFEMSLAPNVPDLIKSHLGIWLEQWLTQCGLSLDAIHTWAVHPGGPRILQAVEAALNLSPEALAVSREVLASYGNMSSPTLLFILKEMSMKKMPGPCLALGFGPGLVVEAAYFHSV